MFRVAQEIVKAGSGHAVLEFPSMRNVHFRIAYEVQIPEFIEYTLVRVGQVWKCRCAELQLTEEQEEPVQQSSLLTRNTVTANAIRQTR